MPLSVAGKCALHGLWGRMLKQSFLAVVATAFIFCLGVIVGQSFQTVETQQLSATNREMSIRILELEAGLSTCQEEK